VLLTPHLRRLATAKIHHALRAATFPCSYSHLNPNKSMPCKYIEVNTFTSNYSYFEFSLIYLHVSAIITLSLE
jgi:hypothetical protein